MQKSMDKNSSNRFSSPKTYFLKSGIGAGNFHSKLKRDLTSPNEKKVLKSFGYRRDSNRTLGNRTSKNADEPQAGSPKFSKYFNNSNKKKSATTRNRDAKKIVFFQKSKKDEISKVIESRKMSGKTSPRAKARGTLDPIKGSHKPIISARRATEVDEKVSRKSGNASKYGKPLFKKIEESTRRTDEKSKVNKVYIKWEGSKWPDIQSQLLFGQCIGEGSFAKVYDAFDKVLKKAVAVKVIKKKMFKSLKKRKLVQMEVDILASLDHKNIVKFYRMLEDHKRVTNFHKNIFSLKIAKIPKISFFLKKNHKI